MPRLKTYGRQNRGLAKSQPIPFYSPEPVRVQPSQPQNPEESATRKDSRKDRQHGRASVKSDRRALEGIDANKVSNPVVSDPKQCSPRKKNSAQNSPVKHTSRQDQHISRAVVDEADIVAGAHQDEPAPCDHDSTNARTVVDVGPTTPVQAPLPVIDQSCVEASDVATASKDRERQQPKLGTKTPFRDSNLDMASPVPIFISAPEEVDAVPVKILNEYERHCESILAISSQSVLPFDSWSAQMSEHFNLTKIAEASFGEVYRLSLLDDLSDFSIADESVFKVIALQPPECTLPLDKRKRRTALKKAADMSKPSDVATEVKLLQRMSTIPGFTNFRDVRIVQGRPPPAFAKAFKGFNAAQKARGKDLSHFPDPGKKSSYADDQLWAVIEMQDAGTDLERLVESHSCTSIWAVWDVFWQVVLSLAKGEEGAQFEHRDLHPGNVCVRDLSAIPEDGTSDQAAVDLTRKLGFTAAETTIIDYTISRCAMPDGDIAYTDLALDSALFEGDSAEEYQYDIYRFMRAALFLDDASAAADFDAQSARVEASGRSWQQFHPQTNLVWLHLVLHKLLEQLDWPSEWRLPQQKKTGPMVAKEQRARWKRANELEEVLLRVQGLLEPSQICANGMRSAGDLVILALGEDWIGVQDIVGGAEDETDLVEDLESWHL